MRLYTLFDSPLAVFTCRVNQTFSTHDRVVSFAYDGASGDVSKVEYGMTVWVGSTPGAQDIGQTFVRKAPAGGYMFVSPLSSIPWADDLYISVVDDWNIWAEGIKIADDGTFYMRWDVPYSDQNTNLDPMPMLGNDRAIRYTGTLAEPDQSVLLSASSSWCLGSSIVGFAWSIVSGNASLTNETTATPTLTTHAAGRIVLKCLVTAANGKSRAGYRTYYFFDLSKIKRTTGYPYDENGLIYFPMSVSWSGSKSSGGYEAKILMKSRVTLSAVKPRTKVLIFTNTETKFVGWITDEGIQLDRRKGQVEFQLATAHAWLMKMTALPCGLEYNDSPAYWTDMPGLTYDKYFWHMMTWRSTLPNLVDITPTGDTRLVKSFSAQGASLWEQLRSTGSERLFATVCCNQLSQVFVSINPSLRPDADRAALTTTYTFTKDDYKLLSAEIPQIESCSRVNLSGMSFDGTDSKALFSLAPGHEHGHYGGPLQVERIVLSNQAQSNKLSAMYYAWKNYSSRYTIDLLREEHALGVMLAPDNRVDIPLVPDDTLRGITSPTHFIPERVSFDYKFTRAGLSSMSSQLEAVAETNGDLAINGDIPSDGVNPPWVPPEIPPFPPIVIPPVPPIPPVNPPIVPLGLVGVFVTATGQRSLWFTSNFADATPTWVNGTSGGGWNQGHLNSVSVFKMNLFGRFYLVSKVSASDQYIYSGIIGIVGCTLIADTDYFVSQITPGGYGGYPNIAGIGLDLFSDKTLAVHAQKQYPTSTDGWFLTNGGDSLTKTKSNSGVCEVGGNGAYYNGKWYWMNGATLDQQTRLYRLNTGLTTFEYTRLMGSVPFTLVHAAAADYIYTTDETKGVVMTNNGETEARHFDRNAAGGMDCDPTGQYVMIEIGGPSFTQLKLSSDYGASWVSLTSFPHHNSITRDTAKIRNMGNADEWVVCYNQYPSNTFNIKYTPDRGVTWQDKIGNLLDYVPATTGSLGAQYA